MSLWWFVSLYVVNADISILPYVVMIAVYVCVCVCVCVCVHMYSLLAIYVATEQLNSVSIQLATYYLYGKEHIMYRNLQPAVYNQLYMHALGPNKSLLTIDIHISSSTMYSYRPDFPCQLKEPLLGPWLNMWITIQLSGNLDIIAKVWQILTKNILMNSSLTKCSRH